MKRTLLSCLALIMSVLAMGEETDWNFSSQSVTIDGKSYYLDVTNKVAQLYTYASKFDSLTVIPATVNYEGSSYTVRSMKGLYSTDDIRKVVALQLPVTMLQLDDRALHGFDNLRDITLSTTTPPAIHSNYKNGTTIRAKLYVPAGSIHDYRIADTKWNDFVIIDGSGKSVVVTLTNAGTLSAEIVKKADYLQDVNILKVSGEMNTEDLNIIKNNMPNLVSIDLGDAVLKTMPEYWIDGKWGVETITLPKTLETIGRYAFKNCYHLRSINFPASLRRINYNAFENCIELQKALLNEGLEEIEGYVFYNCSGLQEVYIPSTLKTISDCAFYNTKSLSLLNISEGVENINRYAFQDSGLKKVTLPSSMNSINSWAFSSCPLESITLNEGLETIDYNAFSGCSVLKEITIPSTVKYIMKPFDNCGNLKNIYVKAGIPPYVNGNCPINNVSMNDVVLHVPGMSQSLYKSTPGWSYFYTIENIDNYRPQAFTTSENSVIDIDENLTFSNYKPLIETFISDWNGKKYGAVTVNGSGAMNISKYSAFYDYNLLSSYNDNSTYMTSLVNNITMTADSIATTLYTQDQKWTFVSFPYDVKVKDIVPFLDGTTSFAVREYSGENRAMGDMNYTWVKLNAESTLKAYRGYAINTERRINNSIQWYSGLRLYSSAKSVTIAKDDVSIPLTAYPSEFTQNQGWNLIGNPYPCYFDVSYMDFTAPITVWNMRNNTYMAYSPKDDEYILSPGEAFFVQASGNNQGITFAKEGRQTNRIKRAESNAKAMYAAGEERQIINLSLTDGTSTDRTRIVINENAQAAYETDKDAPKFISTEAAQIYTVSDGVQYAINERPFGNGIMNIGTYFKKEGEYSISLMGNTDAAITLIDREEGKSVSLSEGNAYTFSAKEGSAQRFVISIGDATAIDEIPVSEADNAEDVWYNVAGQRVNADAKGLRINRKGYKVLRF